MINISTGLLLELLAHTCAHGGPVIALLMVLTFFSPYLVHADPVVEPIVVQPPSSIDWNNALPAQRQALDSFYQVLQNMQQANQQGQLPNFEQLPDINSEQRHQILYDLLLQQRQVQQDFQP